MSINPTNQQLTEIPQRVRVSLHSVDLRVFVGDMEKLLNQPDSPIHWKIGELIKITDNVWFLPSGTPVDDILRASGHSPKKIDMAVPQAWFELPEVKERRDTGDKPMWSYEQELFGEPLWLSKVYEDLKKEILAALPEE